ncbi:hypothetical protein J6590_026367 [Homalodisca vitripennis]|nr:hypothetical protein J6590_026367 [Homalodisca vitripennis]
MDDIDDEPVDDSDEDPNYVVSDNELNQSESDDSFAVDEPQLEDEDGIHYSVENYLVQESENYFFWGKDGSVWCRKEPPKQRRTPQHNILRGPLPGPTARARALGNNPLITRFEFIKRLTLKLIKHHMTRRLEVQNLPRDIRRVITEYVGETEAANPNEMKEEPITNVSNAVNPSVWSAAESCAFHLILIDRWHIFVPLGTVPVDRRHIFVPGCLAHICAAWSLGMFTISSLVQFKVSGQKSHDPVKLNKRLRCHVCRIRQKKRKTTFFTCSSCTDEKDNKFGLCMPECFNEFHK